MLRLQSKAAIALDNVPTISGAFDPPEWWVALLKSRVKVGAGRAPVPAGIFRQADLLSTIADRFGREHTAPEVSRALNGKRIPIQLAIDTSEVLEIPAPFYVSTGEEEARRLESQRAVTRMLVKERADRAERQLADTLAGVPRSGKRSQTAAVKLVGGEESSRRGVSGRGTD